MRTVLLMVVRLGVTERVKTVAPVKSILVMLAVLNQELEPKLFITELPCTSMLPVAPLVTTMMSNSKYQAWLVVLVIVGLVTVSRLVAPIPSL
jgi:hypothetical protein